MKHLMTLIALVVAVTAGAQSTYDPDVNGDGCITVTDVLGVLSLFDTCEEGATVYYFMTDMSLAPYGNNSFGNNPFPNMNNAMMYVVNGNWVSTGNGSVASLFHEAVVWMIQHQGEEVSGLWNDEEISVLVQPLDSITNVSLPLSNSIPNGTIQFPETEFGIVKKLIIPTSLYTAEFLGDNNIFYPVSNPCSPANTAWSSFWGPGTTPWQDESYVVYDLCDGEFCYPNVTGVYNVVDGY